jgi:glycosyltransferase involved in cell wall biosynthesis
MTSSLTKSVSVVITCYNQASFLGEAIETVLRQTCPPREVVVVDDGSQDDTAEVVNRYSEIRYIRQVNQGVVAARNNGWRETTSAYVVFLDGDDRLAADALEVGSESLDANLKCGFAFGRCRLIAADGASLTQTSPLCAESDFYAALLRRNEIWMPAQVIYRRAVLEAVGGFCATFDHGSDYELYLRIAQKYPTFAHGNIVAEWRQHNANTTRDAVRMLKAATGVHRAQATFVRAHRQYEQAYREGAKEIENYFGERVIADIRTQMHARDNRKQAAKAALTLLRYCPALLTKHIRRKLYCTLFRIEDATN